MLTKSCSKETCGKSCLKCVKNHIEAEVNSKADFKVKCPTCRTLLDEQGIKQYGRPKDFERYDKLLLNKTLGEMPDFRWCKEASCGSGQLHDGGPVHEGGFGRSWNCMTCDKCKKRSCFNCDVPFHDGITCEDYQARVNADPDNAANADYLARLTKPCPKCNRSIEKNDGCDHMTCQEAAGGCGHEFCWRCLADYQPILDNGNHYHKPTCTWYAEYDSDAEDDDDYDEDEDEEDDDEE